MKAKSNATEKELVESKEVCNKSGSIARTMVKTIANGVGYGYEGNAPCWEWTVPESGTYYVKVNYDWNTSTSMNTHSNGWLEYSMWKKDASTGDTGMIGMTGINTYASDDRPGRTNIFVPAEVSAIDHFNKGDKIHSKVKATAAGLTIDTWLWWYQLKAD